MHERRTIVFKPRIPFPDFVRQEHGALTEHNQSHGHNACSAVTVRRHAFLFVAGSDHALLEAVVGSVK